MAKAGSNYEKNWGSKISLDCPFKQEADSTSSLIFVLQTDRYNSNGWIFFSPTKPSWEKLTRTYVYFVPSRDKTIPSFTQITLSPLYRINVEDAGFEPGRVTFSHRVALLFTSQTNPSQISAVEQNTLWMLEVFLQLLLDPPPPKTSPRNYSSWRKTPNDLSYPFGTIYIQTACFFRFFAVFTIKKKF